jgi:2'-5' RNA ligase
MDSMYFIAIVLPEELNQRILVFKQYMFEKYKCQVGLKSPAHITLIPPYWMNEEKENLLKKDLEIHANSFRPFSLRTLNFSSFPPKTIFIALEENAELKNVKTRTDVFFTERPEYKMKLDNHAFHPHITIATRDLYKKSFYEAWEHFQPMEFREIWLVENLSLLKHNKKNWDVIHTSQFNSFI